ncbi:MAG: large-conductance mechanosensitive channel protein MscL [Oscillospiraceae bacterium]|nr:large-conductance mechanosensitive channel protein MscL [Oscillospiraceae bacterium]
MAKDPNKKGFFGEFKEFIMRGNVLDMAVGVIIATAFGKITTSLVNDVFMPFISWIFGARDMTALNVVVRAAQTDEAGEVVKEAITLGFGTFVSTIIDFILVALVVFLVVKSINKARAIAEAKKAKEEVEEEAPAEPEPSAEEKLLTEIRDLLKDKQ